MTVKHDNDNLYEKFDMFIYFIISFIYRNKRQHVQNSIINTIILYRYYNNMKNNNYN